jgi:N-acetylglutamate synthase-like GNAT family acetyltransferase
MINIRLAQERDFDGVLELIKEFQEESINAYDLLCDDKIAKALMPEFLETSLVMLLDGELIGVIAGRVMDYPLNGEKVFQEVLWFVKKEHRIYSSEFLTALEEQVKKWGIKKLVMSYFGHLELDRFYRAKGYRFLEAHYIKNIGG